PVRRLPAGDHDGRQRRPCPPRRLRLAELVLERGQRRAGDLATPDRHVRGRHDDVTSRGLRARPPQAPAPRRLRLSDFAHKARGARVWTLPEALPERGTSWANLTRRST